MKFQLNFIILRKISENSVRFSQFYDAFNHNKYISYNIYTHHNIYYIINIVKFYVTFVT